MLRTASTYAGRAAFRASSEAAEFCNYAVASSVLPQAAWTFSSPAHASMLSNTATFKTQPCHRAFPSALIGRHCFSSGLAGKNDEPVPEGKLEDKGLSHEAAHQPNKTYDQGHIAPHKGLQMHGSPDPKQQLADAKYWLMQPVYSHEYTESVKPRHISADTIRQKLANTGVFVMRTVFDRATSYNLEGMSEKKWLRRILFLETIAGVPGMVGGMLRHMRSLRSMKRDNGWIHTLLEEAENERMHLLTFLELRKPGLMFRGMVLLSQGIFFNAYFLAYILSPKSCHAFVGYLEEEAVKTYTHAISDLDKGRLPEWSTKKVPEIARDYWKLGEDATMRDLLLSVRADEACHSHVNHTFSQMESDGTNPFVVGTHVVPAA